MPKNYHTQFNLREKVGIGSALALGMCIRRRGAGGAGGGGGDESPSESGGDPKAASTRSSILDKTKRKTYLMKHNIQFKRAKHVKMSNGEPRKQT